MRTTPRTACMAACTLVFATAGSAQGGAGSRYPFWPGEDGKRPGGDTWELLGKTASGRPLLTNAFRTQIHE